MVLNPHLSFQLKMHVQPLNLTYKLVKTQKLVKIHRKKCVNKTKTPSKNKYTHKKSKNKNELQK